MILDDPLLQVLVSVTIASFAVFVHRVWELMNEDSQELDRR